MYPPKYGRCIDFVLMSSLAYCFPGSHITRATTILLSYRSKQQLYCEGHAMAQCGYSSLIESDTTCGPHWKYPKDVECIALKDCKKDVTSHLRF